MKFRIFFNSLLFFKIIVEVKNQQQTPHLPNKTDTSQPKSTPPLQHSDIINQGNSMSIQDIILSEINANHKIEEGIVDMIMKYSSNYSSYKAVHFTTSDYMFEKNSMEYDFDYQQEKGKIHFDNFKVTSSYNNDPTDPKFSTHVQCNATGNTTIIIDLPDINIASNVGIILSSPAPTHYDGSISITLENGTLIGQIELESNNTLKNRVNSTQIINDISKHDVKIHSKYQHLVHDHLKNISDEVKRSMEKYLRAQLNLQAQLILNVTMGCSKGKLEKTDQSNLTDLYVINDRKHDSWLQLNQTTGPAVIEGLANFDQIDFHMRDVSFQDFNNMPCTNELSLRMISNSLKGRFMWFYNHTMINSPELTYRFTMDYFEIRCNMTPVLDSNPGFNIVKTTIEMNFGEIKVSTAELNYSDDESNFVKAILSDHLEYLITSWLDEVLKAKLVPKIGYFDCLTGSPV